MGSKSGQFGIKMVTLENGRKGEWNLPDAEFTNAKVYNITADGNEYICDVIVTDNKFSSALNLVRRLL